ncbi:MAG: NusA-like transcription termination signal-binding factor [Candidatus Woesearchaeota archaeon]|jgi:N utilization substance protein A
MAVRLRLDQDTLALSSILERIAKVRVKDCFKDDSNEMIYFVVDSGELGKAIGKGGVNIRILQTELNKRVRIIEYHDNVVDFIRGFIHPAEVAEVVQEDHIINIKDENRKTKSLLIGRDGKNLKLLNRAVKRFFNIEEVKII